jgi:hypothetical protein
VYRYGVLREFPLRSTDRGVRNSQRFSFLTFPGPQGEHGVQTRSRASTGLPDLERVLGNQAPVEPGSGVRLSFGQLPLLALSLVLVSAFLLIGALLPPRMLEHARVPPARCARVRESLALAALGILLPVAVGSLAVGLS